MITQNCFSHNTCITRALQQASTICQDKGLRFTKLRRKILKIIWASHAPAKAYDLLDKLKKTDTSAKPPTVYRTLDFLMDNGFVHKLNSLNAYVGCSHPHKHHECYFLICHKCTYVSECCSHDLEKTIISTAKKHQFQLRHTTLEIEGECQSCKQNS